MGRSSLQKGASCPKAIHHRTSGRRHPAVSPRKGCSFRRESLPTPSPLPNFQPDLLAPQGWEPLSSVESLPAVCKWENPRHGEGSRAHRSICRGPARPGEGTIPGFSLTGNQHCQLLGTETFKLQVLGKEVLPQTPIPGCALPRALVNSPTYHARMHVHMCACAHALAGSSSACQHVGLLSIALEQFYLINKNRSKITFGKQHIFKRKRRSE